MRSMPALLSRALQAVFVLPLVSSIAFAQGSPNVQLLAHVNSYPSAGYNDCWGYTAPDGREYALLGVQTGTSIIDITNAPSVSEVTFIPSQTSLWKDIKTYRHYAYVVNETGGGMQIIDLSNLPDTATLAGTYAGFSTSHNISIDTANAILYAEGSGSQPVRAISLANPLSPVQASFFGISSHDILGRNNIAYVSEGGNGSIGIFNISNPSVPVLVKRFSIPQAGYVHNAWPTDDGQYLMTTEETTGKSVKLWNISNLNAIHMTSEYRASPFIAHNTHIKGNYAYISYYTEGLRIVDISNPDSIREVGYYDTYGGPGGGFDGAWGAFPFFASGKVLISDMQTGLYVVFFAGGTTGTHQPDEHPSSFKLHQNYPNPFNPSTTIRFTLGSAGFTSIRVFDLLGRELATLVNVVKSQGTHEQSWDAGGLAGGVYIYRIDIRPLDGGAPFSSSRKMVLVK